MNLDNLFEDLEAQFDGYVAASQQRGVLEVSHVMRVWHQGEQITELAAPILGSDFVAGMALGENVFRLIRLVTVSKISLIRLPGADVPACRMVPLAVSEFLERLPLPFSIRWQPIGDKSPEKFVVLDLLGQSLLVETVQIDEILVLPLDGMAHLELADVENFDSQS